MVDEIAAAGGRAMAVPADVADGRAALKMFTRFLTVWDALDIVVNNAGMVFLAPHVAANFAQMANEMLTAGRPHTALNATATMEDGVWRRTLAVHLDGTFHCTREALKVMQVRRRGKIVNMASIAGTTGLAGSPDYCAAKGGIIAFTKSVAKEVAHLNIQVNALAPGFIDTPLLDAMTPRDAHALPRPDPDGSPRHGRGDRRRGAVPGLAGRRLRHRPGAEPQRRVRHLTRDHGD